MEQWTGMQEDFPTWEGSCLPNLLLPLSVADDMASDTGVRPNIGELDV